MKILHYIDDFYPTIGGGELHVDNIVRNLHGFEFEILTNFIRSELREEKYFNNSKIHRITPCNLSVKNNSLTERSLVYLVNILKSYTRLRKKKRLLKKQHYDLIHFHGEGINIEFRTFDKIIRIPLLSILPDFKFLPGKKILTLHSFISYFTNHHIDLWWEKRLISMFENIICVDSFVYRNVKSITEKTGQSKNIWLIPNSVDTNKFIFSAPKISKKLKLLFIGRLTAEKGLNLILDFIKNMPVFIDFVIVGAGLSHLTEDIKRCPNFNNVSLFENINNDQLPEFYQNSDLVLSLVKVPGLPRITLEAMSTGRPVVMLNMGDRSPVVNWETGFLIKDDLEELIALLENINKNRKKLIDISHHARKAVESKYSNDTVLKEIKAVYNSFD